MKASTFTHLLALAPEGEHEEIRRAVGERLIASVEDLYNEVELLQCIEDEYRDETQKVGRWVWGIRKRY